VVSEWFTITEPKAWKGQGEGRDEIVARIQC
jgi:hypothetical protein